MMQTEPIDLEDVIKDSPAYKRWDDDSEWEAIVHFEMARNFGVSSRDVMAKLDRLLRKEATDDSLNYFLEKLSDDEKKIVRDLIYNLVHSRVGGISVEKRQGTRYSFRATKDDLRITFNLPTEGAKKNGILKLPYGFMVDTIARRR